MKIVVKVMMLSGTMLNSLSLPMNRKFSGKGLIGLPPVSIFASPLSRLIKASVTMKGGMSRRAMSVPIVVPVSSPADIPTR